MLDGSRVSFLPSEPAASESERLRFLDLSGAMSKYSKQIREIKVWKRATEDSAAEGGEKLKP